MIHYPYATYELGFRFSSQIDCPKHVETCHNVSAMKHVERKGLQNWPTLQHLEWCHRKSSWTIPGYKEEGVTPCVMCMLWKSPHSNIRHECAARGRFGYRPVEKSGIEHIKKYSKSNADHATAGLGKSSKQINVARFLPKSTGTIRQNIQTYWPSLQNTVADCSGNGVGHVINAPSRTLYTGGELSFPRVYSRVDQCRTFQYPTITF